MKGIRLFATDVDGVLTDAGMYYSESGEELKKFNTRDGMGIKLLQRAGLITAIVTQDRRLIEGLYKPDWKAWFGKVDEVRDGGPDDPRLALILVEAHSVSYMKNNKPRPVILFEVVKALLTGGVPDIGEERRLGIRELEKAQRIEQEKR